MTERSINQARSIDRAISPRIFPRKLFESISSRGQMAGFCMDYDPVSRGFHLKAIKQLQARFIYVYTYICLFWENTFSVFFQPSGFRMLNFTATDRGRSGLRLQITFERRGSGKSWIWRNLLPIIHSGWKRSFHGNVRKIIPGRSSFFLRS